VNTLFVFGSGSGGNALAIRHRGQTLLIDAGFSAREIQRRAASAGLALDKVVGLVLTHEHGDHASGAPRLARDLGIPVLTSEGTWSALRGRFSQAPFRPLAPMGEASVGSFRIQACATSHDAAQPIAIAVEAEGLRLGVAYDLGRPTAAVRWLLAGCTSLVVEANHDEVMLRTSDYPASVRERISGSGGHLSNRAAAELLCEIHHPGLATVVLAHLSARCNDPETARRAVEPALRDRGYTGSLHVALQDRPLPPIELVQPVAPVG
jgi:phosphoribosyl 1,2-cyclic phosphodiesterase